MPDYYAVLGVDVGADLCEVNRAYRRRALDLHPDKGGGVGAFEELQEAHGVLGDVVKRREYDDMVLARKHSVDNAASDSFTLQVIESDCEPLADADGVHEGHTHPCRCGGQYEVLLADIEECRAELAESLLVACTHCSLQIEVVL